MAVLWAQSLSMWFRVGSDMPVRDAVIAALVGLAVTILGVATTGLPLFAIGLVAAGAGVVVVVAVRPLQSLAGTTTVLGWQLLTVVLLVSATAAVWAESVANQGCPGTLNTPRRVLVTLALVAIGVGALSLPVALPRFAVGRGSRPLWLRLNVLVVAAAWLSIWAFLWFVCWRVMFGCVD